MTKFAIRPPTPEDLPALLRMIDALNALMDEPTGRLNEEQLRESLFGDEAFLFADIAMLGESPIGYALSHDAFTSDVCEKGVYLVDLYVEEPRRRSGVGVALMQRVAKRAKSRGATHLWWASAQRNYQARRFYKSIGSTAERFFAHAVFGDAFAALCEDRQPLGSDLPTTLERF